MDNISKKPIRCGSCIGIGLVKKECFICQNCYGTNVNYCYLCENTSRSLFVECFTCFGSGSSTQRN